MSPSGKENFAETLNFYISDSENGISRVPRQKLVEIQSELRRIASLSVPTPGTGGAEDDKAAKVIARTMCVMEGENPDERWVAPDDVTAARWEHRLPWARTALEAARPYLSATQPAGDLGAVKVGEGNLAQCGWAYQDKRWDADRT